MSAKIRVEGDTVLKGVYTEEAVLEIEGDGGTVVVEPGELKMCLGGKSKSSQLKVVVLDKVHLVCIPVRGESATIGFWGQNAMPYVVLRNGASIQCPELNGHREMVVEEDEVKYQIGTEGPMLHLVYEETPSVFEGKIQIDLVGYEQELGGQISLADLITKAEGVVLEKILAQCKARGFAELEGEFSLETVTLLAMWYCPELQRVLKEQGVHSLVELFEAAECVHNEYWSEETVDEVEERWVYYTNIRESGCFLIGDLEKRTEVFTLQISEIGEVWIGTGKEEESVRLWRLKSGLTDVVKTLALIGILASAPAKVLSEFRSTLLFAKSQVELSSF